MSNGPGTEMSLGRAGARGLLVSAIFFSIFTNLLVLTGPIFMLQIYDRVLGSRSEETLVAMFGLVTALYGFYWLLDFARGRVMARVGARLEATVDKTVFNANLERAALHTGSGKGTLRDLEAIRTVFNTPVLLALLDMPWTPVFLCAIFIFHPYLGWLALLGGSILVVVALLNQIFTKRHRLEATKAGESAHRFA